MPRRPICKDFRSLYRLEGKVVALFAGVIGPSQGLQFLVETAMRVSDLHDLVILIVGDGTERVRVMSMAATQILRNVVFQPYVLQDDYPDLLASCDIGLICLSPDVRTPVVPGKLLGYMAASLPIAAFVNSESDVHAIVATAQCGESCVSSDIGRAAQVLRTLHASSDRRRSLGRAGYDYARANFSREVIIDQIEHLLGCG